MIGAVPNLCKNLRAAAPCQKMFFIVSATGKTAEQMLVLLQERTKNSPKAELEIAAHEQRKITQLRLEKMLSL